MIPISIAVVGNFKCDHMMRASKKPGTFSNHRESDVRGMGLCGKCKAESRGDPHGECTGQWAGWLALSALDDDDGVGLRTDGPLISLKTHEDSQGGGGPGWSKGWTLPLEVSVSPSMGAKHPCQPPYVLRIRLLTRICRLLFASKSKVLVRAAFFSTISKYEWESREIWNWNFDSGSLFLRWTGRSFPSFYLVDIIRRTISTRWRGCSGEFNSIRSAS